VRPRALLALCIAFFSAMTPAVAQSPTDAPSGALITHRDIALLLGATVASVALYRVDSRVAVVIGDSAFHAHHPDFTTAAKRGSLPTETLLMITGGTVWGISRLRHDDGAADVALHSTEAVASMAMVIQVVRGVLGRGRPYVIDDAGDKRDGDPYEFQLLHGFTSFNYRSYPSMHAMASFAVASALAQEMRLRNTPDRQAITPALYAAATLPALSRMYLDEHWTSDIALGAVLGIFAGQKAVLYNHDHPDNRVNRFLLKPSLRVTVTQHARGYSLSILPF
jgi:membrane-associated phospholipid phosphatase